MAGKPNLPSRRARLSLLQFRKKPRLPEAGRLMLAVRLDVATAAFTVDAERPSPFCREYSRRLTRPAARYQEA